MWSIRITSNFIITKLRQSAIKKRNICRKNSRQLKYGIYSQKQVAKKSGYNEHWIDIRHGSRHPECLSLSRRSHGGFGARAGNTLNQSGFWEFNSKFPNELYPSSELAHKFGSNFGLWVGPRGGYNFYGHLADIVAKSGKGSKAGGSIDVADRVYVKNLTDMFCDFQDRFQVNYWKWDGFADNQQYNHFPAADGVPGYGNRHMTGGYQHMYHVTDLWEAWIDLMEAVRANAKENGIDNLWLSLTCYTNPSPWFLQWANSVWMQCVYDQKDANFGTSKMDMQMTCRDAVYYDFLVNHQFQFPLANLYNHDPIYGKEGTGMTINSATDDNFQNYLYMQSTRGITFWELLFSDSILTDGKYEVTGEFLEWAEENSHILRNAKIFGGMPDITKLENGESSEYQSQAYGFSCFDGTDGIISIRNPHSYQTKTVSFTFDRQQLRLRFRRGDPSDRREERRSSAPRA